MLINGRTPEDIKRRLECASFDCDDTDCYDCKYLDICSSVVNSDSSADALALIEYYEQRIEKQNALLAVMGITIPEEAGL